MVHPIKKARVMIPFIVLTVCFSLAFWSPAIAAEKAKKGPEPAAGQVCPAPTAEKSLCTVNIDCPPITAPGRTLCQPALDCPPPKPAKPAKEKKK